MQTEKTTIENLERLEVTIAHLKKRCGQRTPAEIQKFLTTYIKDVFKDA